MNQSPRYLSRVLAVLLIVLSPSFAHAVGGVTVEIKRIDTSPKPAKVAKAPPKDPKKESAKPPAEIEKNKLAITLRNVSKEEMKGLQVKYYFFSRSPGESGIDILKQGVKSADIGPNTAVTVESDEAEATFTPSYNDKKAGRIKAVGTKIAGYGAQVLSGDKVVGEFFSSETMKKALTAVAH